MKYAAYFLLYSAKWNSYIGSIPGFFRFSGGKNGFGWKTESLYVILSPWKDILERKTGKIRFPDDVLQNARVEESDDATAGMTYTMVDLFKNSSMACITVNIMFQWFVNTMTYYGLLFGAGELPGSGIRF